MSSEPDFTSILGMTPDEAQAHLGDAYIVRTTLEDGEDFVLTMDWRTNRVNVGVTDGKISTIEGVG